MQTPDEGNIIFKTAADFINNTNHPVFLTGKAGTGKTTFLKYIKEHTRKNTAIVAPTGVAAINAGGTTIHSFFQLPFGPYLPLAKKHFSANVIADKNSLLGNLKLSAERKEIMELLELLIIDEISMVRCDVLDAIDAVLRHVRRQHSKPFGGVQVLYIGDMYQLSPVVKEDEWRILSEVYINQYFFSSLVVAEQSPVYIELKKVYRQSDFSFINLLNQVRNNEMDEAGYNLLHSRHMPGYKPAPHDNFITLTTHNSKADAINREALAILSEKNYSFTANIDGSFFENSFPADEILSLKVGAQVMFLKNDTEKIRRYYNGKIGVVKKIEEDKIWVECTQENSSQLIEVKRETWRNIKYALNSKTKQIEEEELGSFTQYPLRLAWAITIHKSQGLTFQNAIIDAGNAFTAGQVYVALSRCTTLEGIILHSKISYDSLHSDDRIVQFAAKQEIDKKQEEILICATRQYEQEIIFQLFNFTLIGNLLKEFSSWHRENNVFGSAVAAWLPAILSHVEVLTNHSKKFEAELEGLFSQDGFPSENPFFQERIKKAANWFFNEIEKTKNSLLKSPAITDNRQLAKDYNIKIGAIFEKICLLSHLLNAAGAGFSLSVYSEQKALFKKESFPLNAYAGKSDYVSQDITHPELYNMLKEKRNEIAAQKNTPIYIVCKTQSLDEMTQFLPRTLEQLKMINGFGPVKIRQYGKQFIDIIKDYCDTHNLEYGSIPIERGDLKKSKKPIEGKSTTKKITYDLLKSGKSLQEIATERNLSLTTIETHLAHFIEIGELDIDSLMDKQKKQKIIEIINASENKALSVLKEQMPFASYGEIKWVLADEKSNNIRVEISS